MFRSSLLAIANVNNKNNFILSDVHRVLRWRRPRLDHRGPGQGPDGKADRLRLPADVRGSSLPPQERHHPPRPQGRKRSPHGRRPGQDRRLRCQRQEQGSISYLSTHSQ